MKKGCSQSVLNSVMKFDFSLQISGENLIFIKNELIEEKNYFEKFNFMVIFSKN